MAYIITTRHEEITTAVTVSFTCAGHEGKVIDLQTVMTGLMRSNHEHLLMNMNADTLGITTMSHTTRSRASSRSPPTTCAS